MKQIEIISNNKSNAIFFINLLNIENLNDEENTALFKHSLDSFNSIFSSNELIAVINSKNLYNIKRVSISDNMYNFLTSKDKELKALGFKLLENKLDEENKNKI